MSVRIVDCGRGTNDKRLSQTGDITHSAMTSVAHRELTIENINPESSISAASQYGFLSPAAGTNPDEHEASVSGVAAAAWVAAASAIPDSRFTSRQCPMPDSRN